MKHSAFKSKVKGNKISSVVNYDYIWIFSNGSESEQNHRRFKNLKDIWTRSYYSSRLVLKTADKGYR
jgi:hypothetical protein